MALMTWNDRMSVGIDSIDEQHMGLVRMLNDLAEAIDAGESERLVGEVLEGLANYTVEHFGHEEVLMEEYTYPKMAEHKRIHADFVKTVLDVKARYDAGASDTLSYEVLNFLKRWLLKHIQGDDASLGKFLQRKGVREVEAAAKAAAS